MQRLLEREHELTQLGTLVDHVRAGASRVAVLEAPAGIGKTRLIDAVCAVATERGMRVLTARGSEREQAYPFGVVRQLLEPVVVAASDDRRRALFTGAAALAQPVFDRSSDGEVPDDASFSTLHGLYWLLVAVADGGPLLLAVDDMHWSDAPSDRFLSFLGLRLEGLSAAGEAAGGNGLASEFARDPQTELISPGPLSEVAVAQLASETLGREADPAFSLACWEATGGNPFFLDALLGELVSEDVAPNGAEVARVRGLGPETVLRSIFVRLRRLPLALWRSLRPWRCWAMGQRSRMPPSSPGWTRAQPPWTPPRRCREPESSAIRNGSRLRIRSCGRLCTVI
jgi:hypothetical protein